MTKFLSITLAFSFVFACHNHLLVTKPELSRENTYISFVKNTKPYQVTAEIGGESIHHTKVIAFSGERYLVEVTPGHEDLDLYIDGVGIEVDTSDGFKRVVRVSASETFIDISLTAHPNSQQFTLQVSQLNP